MAFDISVVGFGDNVVDIYLDKDRQYPGGNCVNLAVYAKMFGARRAGYLGYFGSDENAEQVISALGHEGVETTKCAQITGENGYSRCTLEDGERVFRDYNQGGVRSRRIYTLDRFDIEYLAEFDLVHSGSYCYTESQLPTIKAHAFPLSFDFSDDSTDDYYRQIAPMVTYAFCSFSGTDDETEERLKWIASFGPELVCASRGPAGCMLYAGGQLFVQEAVPIEKVTDSMGAGDSLIATFMVAYLDRIKHGDAVDAAIRSSLTLAARFASTVCQMEGAFGHGSKVLVERLKS